jgi:hypothetical protein
MAIAPQRSRLLLGLPIALSCVLIACPPIELRVSIDADSVEGAVADCVTDLGGEPCGNDVSFGPFFASTEQGLNEGVCLAVQLAMVATPEEGKTSWPKDRRAFSRCVELEHGMSFGAALDVAVQASLKNGLAVDDVEGAEDAFFVLGLFGSVSGECKCDSEGDERLMSCSRLREDADDPTLFGITCTQCSGRKVAKGGDFASCAAFAEARCFFEGCADVFAQ